jgi:serine/threonine protein kinase
MTTTLACPDETEMLAVAMGEPVAAAVTAHVDGCVMCRARRDRLKAELASLRQDHGYAPTPPDPFDPESVAEARECAQEKGRWPDAIGKYKVVGWIDGGGEADVFRVVHINLGNDLVLKLSRIEVAADMQSGLVAVGQMLIDLQHPNLVRIFDLDFHDDRPFLVMEYVRGCNLEQHAGTEAVTPRRAAELVAKLAEVMAVAHQHGITHCDIKPKNILVDKLGEPRLIDFGMARLRHAWADRPPSSCGGTVAYMAPEQARLEFDRIGPRSDIFALGGVLYFLLTGQPPFVGQTQDEAWDRARRCDFEAGALRAAKVPRLLEQICLKAMAADPAGRYATADALQRALKRYLAWPKMLAVAGTVCGVALLGGLVYAVAPPRLIVDISSEHVKFQRGQVENHPTSPASLAGELTVRVWSKKDGGKRGLKIDEPGALPLRPGEQVHLEAQLNQPAYSCILWLDAQGHVSQLYPRDDGKFGSRPSGSSARETVHSPEALDEGHRMSGPGGLETALLLVRRAPLPAGTDLAGLIGPLPPSPLRSELEVAKRGFNEGQPVEKLRVDIHRGIDDETEKIDDPLLQLMDRLRTQNQFEVIKAVRFAYRGE